MALLGVPCSGCLVTEKHTFEEEPNLPPAILSMPGHPAIGAFQWIDRVERPEWRFRVRVRDENVDQELNAHWRVVHREDMEPDFVPRPVPVSGEPIRELEIFVNTASLRDYECHRLELVVSGSFPPFTAPKYFDTVVPGDEDDVARADWWIWEGEGRDTPLEEKAGIVDSCEAIENLMAAEPAQVQEPEEPR